MREDLEKPEKDIAVTQDIDSNANCNRESNGRDNWHPRKEKRKYMNVAMLNTNISSHWTRKTFVELFRSAVNAIVWATMIATSYEDLALEE